MGKNVLSRNKPLWTRYKKLPYQQFQDKLISYLQANSSLPSSRSSSLLQLTEQILSTSFQNPVQPHLQIQCNLIEKLQMRFFLNKVPVLDDMDPNIIKALLI